MKIWMPVVNKQPFAETNEPRVLMERISRLVSRDKLIEWEVFATDEATKSMDDIFPSVRFGGLGVSVMLFVLSTKMGLTESISPCAERCLRLVLLVVSLWVTEAIPYYATALLILPLVVLMEVFRDKVNPEMPMEREKVAHEVMNSIFNHTSFLLLGGYAISSAISRCQIEISVAGALQSWFGQKPKIFILAVMILGLFLSMWISNHTAPHFMQYHHTTCCEGLTSIFPVHKSTDFGLGLCVQLWRNDDSYSFPTKCTSLICS